MKFPQLQLFISHVSPSVLKLSSITEPLTEHLPKSSRLFFHVSSRVFSCSLIAKPATDGLPNVCRAHLFSKPPYFGHRSLNQRSTEGHNPSFLGLTLHLRLPKSWPKGNQSLILHGISPSTMSSVTEHDRRLAKGWFLFFLGLHCMPSAPKILTKVFLTCTSFDFSNLGHFDCF